MSALANQPSAAPVPSPATQQEPASPVGKQPRRRIWLVAALVVVGGAALWLWQSRQQEAQKAPVATVRVVKAAYGNIQRGIRLGGATSARNFANIVVPMMRSPEGGRALTLLYLAKSGTMIKKGDVLARIDAQPQKDHLDDVEAQVVQTEADIRKRKAEQAIEEENLRQTLRSAKAKLDKDKLDYGAQEIRTTIDQELLKLAVEEDEATYKQQLANIKINEQSNASEIRILEIGREVQTRHRDRHLVDIERFTVIAPMSGLVVMQTLFRGGDTVQIQEGDTLAPGQPFMKIVDLNSMQVEATVNQVESELIRLGQKATIQFDAFPGLSLHGKVYAVGALAVGGWRQNTYIRNIPVRVTIEGTDPRIIPDLSASADIVLDQQENALLIPAEAVNARGAKTFVYVKKDGQYEAREVELGFRNETQVAVKSGLSAGEEVVLGAPPVAKAGT